MLVGGADLGADILYRPPGVFAVLPNVSTFVVAVAPAVAAAFVAVFVVVVFAVFATVFASLVPSTNFVPSGKSLVVALDIADCSVFLVPATPFRAAS